MRPAPGASAGGRAGRPALDGYVVVDKPEGWTSHDAVARARRLLAERRVGHAGTLDPDATGVLVLGVGRATRLMRFVTPLTKSYVAEIVLGTATTTLDASGETTATFDMSGVGLEEVRAAAATLTGRIAQVPPMVSAVKIGGRRLHELARAGIEVDRPARTVDVHRFDVGPTATAGVYRVEVDCSSGTYVRVLAADLGVLLGGGAHLRALRRTAVGPFRVGDAVSLAALDRADVAPAVGLVVHLAQVSAGDELAEWVRHGKVLERRVLGVSGDGPWAVLDEGGGLLAVYEPREGDRVKPVVVLAPLAGTAPEGPAPRPVSGTPRAAE
ncbi:MAG TPA: tRNA pseudouridine(55) synthase TruB [Acidimicrobiales bacterium]|nr:tRNA pseudouridine(55) synthase TruB [Acidimicrobiales bacterium]